MNRVKYLSIISAVLLLSNFAMIGFILLRKPPLHDRGPRNIVIEKLHFDEQQIAAYDTLINAHREALKSRNEAVLKLKKDLYNGLNQSPNPSVKDSLLLEISKVQSSIEETHYTHFEDLKALCKDNQRQDFEAFTKELTGYFGSTKKRKE
jgi:periplasmic protein CpxP/Spy